jgi:hypothetical protein
VGLDLEVETNLQILHQLRRRQLRRHAHQHMHMVRRHRALHDHHVPALTDLPKQAARTLGYPSAQDLVLILRDPYEVILDIEHRVRACAADSSDVTLSRGKAGLRGAALLVWLAGAAAIQGQQYLFRYYGTEDGLTNLAVKVLFQDRTGFLWAATENGLFRYDGHRFRHYGPTEGLAREVILSLGEAPDGSLLVGSRAGLYQEKGDRFEKLAPPGSGSSGWLQWNPVRRQGPHLHRNG